jgi:hypothetical protein
MFSVDFSVLEPIRVIPQLEEKFKHVWQDLDRSRKMSNPSTNK